MDLRVALGLENSRIRLFRWVASCIVYAFIFARLVATLVEGTALMLQ